MRDLKSLRTIKIVKRWHSSFNCFYSFSDCYLLKIYFSSLFSEFRLEEHGRSRLAKWSGWLTVEGKAQVAASHTWQHLGRTVLWASVLCLGCECGMRLTVGRGSALRGDETPLSLVLGTPEVMVTTLETLTFKG